MSTQHIKEDIDKRLMVFCDEFERQVKDLADGIKQDNPKLTLWHPNWKL